MKDYINQLDENKAKEILKEQMNSIKSWPSEFNLPFKTLTSKLADIASKSPSNFTEFLLSSNTYHLSSCQRESEVFR